MGILFAMQACVTLRRLACKRSLSLVFTNDLFCPSYAASLLLKRMKLPLVPATIQHFVSFKRAEQSHSFSLKMGNAGRLIYFPFRCLVNRLYGLLGVCIGC